MHYSQSPKLDPKTTRVARCNHCTSRPVYVWPAASALRLEDVRCPRCSSTLDRTSREAHRIVSLTDEQIVEQRAAAIQRHAIAAREAQIALDEWIEARDLSEHASDEHFRASLYVDRYATSVKHYVAAFKRLRRAASVDA